MKKIIVSLLIFLWPVLAFASTSLEIFSPEILSSPEYAASGVEWGLYNNENIDIFLTDEGALFKNSGDAFLVYGISFNYQDFDVLKISIKVSESTEVTVIPNVSTTGYNTYELKKTFEPSDDFQEYSFSLRLPFFKEDITDLGLNFMSNSPSDVIIKKITLEKNPSSSVVVQAVKDYFKVAPYSPFTVNLIPTPRIFGYSAGAYFLPIIILLLILFFLAPKARLFAGICLLIFWVGLDFRMGYEFLEHRLHDNKTYVETSAQEKYLRSYSDFYTFADFLKKNIEPGSTINFFNQHSFHFSRILQYLVYPSIVSDSGSDRDYQIFYKAGGLSFNEDDKSLYIDGEAVTGPGEVIAEFKPGSIIFKQQ